MEFIFIFLKKILSPNIWIMLVIYGINGTILTPTTFDRKGIPHGQIQPGAQGHVLPPPPPGTDSKHKYLRIIF